MTANVETVTILFTDLVGSTSLESQVRTGGDELDEALRAAGLAEDDSLWL